MDLVSLYYFQELSKDLNMTRTAQRLYISQQTLSNHIHRLEQHVTGIQRCGSPVPTASCHIALALVPDRPLFAGHQVDRAVWFSATQPATVFSSRIC